MTTTGALAVLADASSIQAPVPMEVTATAVPEGEEGRQMVTRRQSKAQQQPQQPQDTDTDAEEQDEDGDVDLDDGTGGGGRKRGLSRDARDEENSVEDSQGEFDSEDEEEEVGHKKKKTRAISIDDGSSFGTDDSS